MFQAIVHRLTRVDPNRLAPLARWLVVGVWAVSVFVLFFLTHTPVPQHLSDVTSQWDKALHFGAYGVLCGLTSLAYLVHRTEPLPSVKLVLGMMIYAAFDEVTQGLVGRTPDFADWMADSAGIVCGMAVMQRLLRFATDHSNFEWVSDFLQRPTAVEPVGE